MAPLALRFFLDLTEVYMHLKTVSCPVCTVYTFSQSPESWPLGRPGGRTPGSPALPERHPVSEHWRPEWRPDWPDTEQTADPAVCLLTDHAKASGGQTGKASAGGGVGRKWSNWWTFNIRKIATGICYHISLVGEK